MSGGQAAVRETESREAGPAPSPETDAKPVILREESGNQVMKQGLPESSVKEPGLRSGLGLSLAASVPTTVREQTAFS